MRAAAALALLLVGLGLSARAAAIEPVRFAAPAALGEAPAQLTGMFERPAGDGPFPAMVLLHGCGGMTDSKGRLTARHADWTKRFAKLGYAVLLIDSFSPRGLGSQCTVRERSFTVQGDRVRDAYAGLAYLQARPDVRPDRIGLMGWSNGASVVLSALATGNAARPAGLAHGFFRAVALYPGCAGVVRAWPDYRPSVPLLILAGGEDDWTPSEPCRRLAEQSAVRGGHVELVIYPNAFHGFDNPDVPLAYWPEVRNGAKPDACCGAHVGTDQAARDDALQRVPSFLIAP